MAERLAHQIVQDIDARSLQPGDVLPAEAEMIRHYDVGRATLREALRLLETQGVLRVKPGPGGGPVLERLQPAHFAETAKLHFQLSGATYRDVMEARLALEPLMAKMAATARSEVRMTVLDAVLSRADAVDLDDDRAYAELSREFHTTVAGMSGNRVMDLLGEMLKEVYDGRIRSGLMPRRQRERVVAVHRAIGEAVLAGDADEAERLMREHMVEFCNLAKAREPGVLDDRVIWH